MWQQVDNQESCNENVTFGHKSFEYYQDELVEDGWLLYGNKYFCVKVSDDSTTYYT
ncbi:MAG: hypothetical protein LBF15_02450 [Candidatus Peribacteria bacterium]|jgi:hypothetical protein|nr:hypothetical protein [Candidatus Peribacteria bacterium]